MYKLFNSSVTKERRRSLRNDMPEAEKKMWLLLRDKTMEGYKFRRQHGIGPYIVDFYCPKIKLVVEIDGDSHFQGHAERYDADRDEFMNSLGIGVVRFKNLDVRWNIDAVAEDLWRCIQERVGNMARNSRTDNKNDDKTDDKTTPNPSFERRGSPGFLPIQRGG